MKHLVLLALSLLCLPAFAEDAKTFSGEITGVVCAHCQEHVTTALLKVEGIKTVEFKPTNLPTVRAIEIKATKAAFTLEEANAALTAANAASYKVTKLAAK